MSELPEGWVECPVGHAEYLYFSVSGKLILIATKGAFSTGCEYFADGRWWNDRTFKDCGIVPVKKAPKPEPVKIVDVAVLEASNDIENCLWCYAERSSDVFYIRDPFRLKPGMKVRVTIEEVIE